MVNYILLTYPRRSLTSLLDSVTDQNHEGLHVFRIYSAKCGAYLADAMLFLALLPTYSYSLYLCTDAVSVFSHTSQYPGVCLFVKL